MTAPRLRRRSTRELRLAEARWWTLLERAQSLALCVAALPRTRPTQISAHVFERAKQLLATIRDVAS